jgi:hypothetical protein
MKTTSNGETLATVLPKMIEEARDVKIVTTGGRQFDAYEPIVLSFDHITCNIHPMGHESAVIRWDAIAAVVITRPLKSA